MRILYIHQYFNTPAMPGGTRSYEMARRFVQAGHEVDLITTRRDPEQGGDDWEVTDEKGVRVHWLSVPYSNRMSYRQRIASFARFAGSASLRAARTPADVVFATSTPLTVALPGIAAARRQRIPMVFEVRDLWPEMPIAVGALRNPLAIWGARSLERLAYRESAAVVALSPGMADGVARTGYPAERIAMIPNGCDPEFARVNAGDGDAFRRAHGLPLDRPMVLYAGSIGYINGLQYLVDTAAATVQLRPDVLFVVIGDGQQDAKVRQRAEERGVLDRSFFMLGRVPKRDIPAAFATASVCTSLFIDVPEMRINSANKFFDGLSAGRPVAINYEGWHADLLRETGAGLALPADAPDRAAAMLVDFLSSEARMAHAGTAARELAGRSFDRDLLAAKLLAVLEKTAARQ